MSFNAVSLLRDIDAYMFDAFETTVDWFTTMTREIARWSNQAVRDGVSRRTVNAGGEGSLNVDVVHRKVLDEMLASPRWSRLGNIWDDPTRNTLVQLWHNLDVYEDTLPGLAQLSKHAIVVTLSNGNYRLLLDMAKNKQIPWDGILSTELFGVFKPTTRAYLAATYHLGIPPERVAMVAAHKWDLSGAAQAKLKTIYVPRPAEDTREIRESMQGKAEGGEVDLVVKDFIELAALVAEASETRPTRPTIL